jgi:hypothetical protein
MYKDGSVTPYTTLNYVAKKNAILSISPGVIFYYSTITAPSSAFDIIITQTNTASWKDMLINAESNNPAVYNFADCTFAHFGKPTVNGDTITVHVTDAIAGNQYIVGTKFSPSSLVGQPLGTTKTSTYTFLTFDGAAANIDVQPKTGGGPKNTVYISIA